MEKAKVGFKPEKFTKNTVRFKEILEDEFAAPEIGMIYVPKGTLAKIGYERGKVLTVTLTVE